MASTNPISFAEAVRHLAAKQLLPTSMDSVGLRQLGAAVRRQSLFSARTTLEGYLQEIQDVVASVVDPQQGPSRTGLSEQTATEGFNPATARAALRDKLRSLGYKAEPGEEDTIKDLSSDARIDLVVKTNTELAQGAGKFVQSNQDSDVVDLWPCWELVRYEAKDQPRNWEQRWRIAAQVVGDAKAAGALGNHGRMVALKSSGIWQALGDGEGGYSDTLGNPYPPFAFNSGMWCDDVSRDEAVQMGLLEDGEEARPAEFDFESLFSMGGAES